VYYALFYTQYYAQYYGSYYTDLFQHRMSEMAKQERSSDTSSFHEESFNNY
jgi:hypothetical protein